ncbi:hypothetical protein QBC46DRAFT_428568 [Diplogelasinospora grovesii]|uniref:Uncharacterized protein n=1 Tax=Diplogelasinospora grovesii TaxID=303347 RepID=A0AAN6RZH8_9PEZI|nr:hypothetical protein QBC46DRAFT_428568 [Diplogelasinospora grovesii]
MNLRAFELQDRTPMVKTTMLSPCVLSNLRSALTRRWSRRRARVEARRLIVIPKISKKNAGLQESRFEPLGRVKTYPSERFYLNLEGSAMSTPESKSSAYGGYRPRRIFVPPADYIPGGFLCCRCGTHSSLYTSRPSQTQDHNRMGAKHNNIKKDERCDAENCNHTHCWQCLTTNGLGRIIPNHQAETCHTWTCASCNQDSSVIDILVDDIYCCSQPRLLMVRDHMRQKFSIPSMHTDLTNDESFELVQEFIWTCGAWIYLDEVEERLRGNDDGLRDLQLRMHQLTIQNDTTNQVIPGMGARDHARANHPLHRLHHHGQGSMGTNFNPSTASTTTPRQGYQTMPLLNPHHPAPPPPPSTNPLRGYGNVSKTPTPAALGHLSYPGSPPLTLSIAPGHQLLHPLGNQPVVGWAPDATIPRGPALAFSHHHPLASLPFDQSPLLTPRPASSSDSGSPTHEHQPAELAANGEDSREGDSDDVCQT